MVDFQSRDTRRGLSGSDDEEEEADEKTAEDGVEEETDETADAEPSVDDTAEPDDASDAEREAVDEQATESADDVQSGTESDSDETATPTTDSEADDAATPRPSGEPARTQKSGDETETQPTAQESGGPPGSKTAAGAQADTPSTDQGATVNAAVVTIGTTGAETDPTGDSLVSALEGAGHSVTARERLRGDHDGIQQSVDALVGRDDVDVVVTAGGTGIRDDELAIEAVHPLLEKALPGFGEAFRTLLFDHIGTGIVAVRSTAGIASGTLVFCLPGDQQAATLAVEEIIAVEAGELVEHLA